jgi:homoserine kinase type II
MLTMDGRIYEMFEFIAGGLYDHSVEATQAAGAELARLHQALADFHPEWTPPQGGYHNETRILAQLASISSRLSSPPDLPAITRSLSQRYEDAARRAEDAGLQRWPRQIIHGDWHPGNVLFRGPQVVAVVDFDAARVEPRALDLANAALQFSITLKGQDPSTWPETLDEARLQAFCRGYDGIEGCRIATSEILALPWLMIEALIVEAVIPIAATGSFAQLDGGAFIRMVDRKAKWIEQSAERLSGLIDKL